MSDKIKPWQKRKPKHGMKDFQRPPPSKGRAKNPLRTEDGRVSTGDKFLDDALAYADETSS